jgi:hypothetical protein
MFSPWLITVEFLANESNSYVCDLDLVPDFNGMYELVDPMTIMFFFRNSESTLTNSPCPLFFSTSYLLVL